MRGQDSDKNNFRDQMKNFS